MLAVNLPPMYKTCPKCGYQRQAEDTAPEQLCPACGLVFRKWLKGLAADQELVEVDSATADTQNWKAGLSNVFFHPRPDLARADFFLYLVIYLVFCAWGFDFIMMDFRSNTIGQSWFHNVNLVFHEAGHIFFIPLGNYWSILGGSLFQVMVPLFLVGAFLFSNRDGFAASICLWWTGQSIMDIAPYIADARALRLPLLGGGTGADTPGRHDWENLLRPFDWLQYDIRIATWVDVIGSGILLIALAWGGYMLYLYSNDIKKI